jgi:selenocysteine lyase/cysteine desulfurase
LVPPWTTPWAGASKRSKNGSPPSPHGCGSDSRLCGIVTFTVDGVPAADVRHRLSESGVNTSVSALASARYDLGPRGLPAVVRASVHYYNTEEDIEALTAALGSPPA